MSLISAVLALATTASTLGTAPMTPMPGGVQLAYEVQKYWVYCINDKTSVEMWDLEQIKVRYGSDVCLLHESTSASGAQSWMQKNFPSGTCSCSE